MAKGITSGYPPLSAVLVPEPVWQVIGDGSQQLGAFGHGDPCAEGLDAVADRLAAEGDGAT